MTTPSILGRDKALSSEVFYSTILQQCGTQMLQVVHSTWGFPVLAGLGLAVSEGDVAGLGETDTGGGMRPRTPSLDEGTYS